MAASSLSASASGARRNALLAGGRHSTFQLTPNLGPRNRLAAGGGAFALFNGRQFLRRQRLVVVAEVPQVIRAWWQARARGGGGGMPDGHEAISVRNPIALYHRVGNGRAAATGARDAGNTPRLAWMDAP
jgi:hypothetical protein